MKKCAVVARSAFSKSVQKNWRVWSTFGRSDVVSRGRRKGLCTFLSKVSKTRGFCSISKNDGRRGTFEEDLERCISRGRRGTKDMFIRDVRRSGRWFPERGCILEHQIFRFAPDFAWQVRHFAWPGITFSWQAQHFTQMEWKNRKNYWYSTRWSALHSTFHIWRRSRRIASFLMLSTWS